MRVGALILAAGASTRLGFPKQLVRIHHETLLERTVRIAADAGCAPIVVVLGASEDLIRDQCKFGDAVVVSNPLWHQGMGSSLATGAARFRDVAGIIVMTCDMPAVDADHLRKLSSTNLLTASLYRGHRGVPAYFPESFLPALEECKGDSGARLLLEDAQTIEVAHCELDIDTQDDLAQVLKIYR